jgi:galactokinase
VITENERVLEASEALRKHDQKTFGQLMYESHRSLRDDYEVSSEELNLMTDIASALNGVYGARMMGGGFGGCTVNLVDAAQAVMFRDEVARQYASKTGKQPDIYIFTSTDGAEEVDGAGD